MQEGTISLMQMAKTSQAHTNSCSCHKFKIITAYRTNMAVINNIFNTHYLIAVRALLKQTIWYMNLIRVFIFCRLRGYETCIGVMSSDFLMGSMGSVVGEKITYSIEKATSLKLPQIHALIKTLLFENLLEVLVLLSVLLL